MVADHEVGRRGMNAGGNFGLPLYWVFLGCIPFGSATVLVFFAQLAFNRRYHI
jgi:hypothetical protein